MKRITRSIALTLNQNGIISNEDIEICAYGLELFISAVGEIALLLIAALFLKRLPETILFFTAFIPLRIYAGGYHADSRLRCFLILIEVFAIFIVLINCISAEVYKIIILSAMVLNTLCVFIMAPIGHPNKKQTKKEIHTYRLISVVVSVAEVVLLTAWCTIFSVNVYAFSFSLGMITNVGSMLSAEIKHVVRGGRFK